MMQILQALLVSASPITIYACQELFDCLDPKLFPQSLKPKTVFQMPWPLEAIASSVPADFLAKFDQRDQFEKLLEMREALRGVVQGPQVRSMMRDNDVRSLELVVIVDSADSEVATMLEGALEDDLNEFFFGCSVMISTHEQNEK